jgi:hypothetical protein
MVLLKEGVELLDPPGDLLVVFMGFAEGFQEVDSQDVHLDLRLVALLELRHLGQTVADSMKVGHAE